MKQIPLTQGKVALVDDADFQRLNQWGWFAVKSRNKWYAARSSSRKVGKKVIFMHNEIMPPPPGMEVDHEDGDGLNNQRHNLRHATHWQNSVNRGKQSDNTSGFKGVSWHKVWRKWSAVIIVRGHRINLGYFETAEAGAHAYDEAAIKHHGPFAKLNFPR